MLRIEMKVKMKNHFDDVGAAVESESRALVDDMMDMVQDKARTAMKMSHGGRLYVKNRVPHKASAPGQAPAIEPPGFSATAGQLYASIAKMPTGPYSGVVFTAVDYASYLELGTSKMRPRPFLRPAARETRTQMNKLAPARYRVRIARAAATGT